MFESLAPHAIDYIQSIDDAVITHFRVELADLEKTVRAQDSLLAGITLDRISQGELDEYKQARDKAEEDWQKVIWDWKILLKGMQFDVQNLFQKIPTPDFDELSRRVDTNQKRAECCMKRCSFPQPGDTVAVALADHLKMLINDEKAGGDPDAATAKAAEHLKTIRHTIDQFLLTIQSRAAEYHEFIADHCLVPDFRFKVRDAFDEARKLYLKQDWDGAEAAMKKVLEIDPKDGPAIKYIERIGHLRKKPPAKDWDGNWAEE